MGYIEECFSTYNCTVTKTSESNQVVHVYKIKCVKPKIETIFNWQPSIYNKLFWDINMTKLMAVLFNGVQFDANVYYDESALQEFINIHYISLLPSDKFGYHFRIYQQNN